MEERTDTHGSLLFVLELTHRTRLRGPLLPPPHTSPTPPHPFTHPLPHLPQGVFAETIRTQHLSERLEALAALEEALAEAAERARVRHVAPSLLAAAVRAAVPGCTEDTVRWGREWGGRGEGGGGGRGGGGGGGGGGGDSR